MFEAKNEVVKKYAHAFVHVLFVSHRDRRRSQLSTCYDSNTHFGSSIRNAFRTSSSVKDTLVLPFLYNVLNFVVLVVPSKVITKGNANFTYSMDI